MSDALTTLTAPLVVQVSDRQLASLLGEPPPTFTRLLIVRNIQEDDRCATLHFQDGSHGCLAPGKGNYAASLRLAERSRERQHPVGVTFGEGSAIEELARADNDVPLEIGMDQPGAIRVTFQGHDGVFLLKPDHPDAARLRALLEAAVLQKGRVWFSAEKSDLSLLDVRPVEGEVGRFRISFVVAPEPLLRTAQGILRSRFRCPKALRREIQAVAKAYIDEADELNRAVQEIESQTARIQIQSLSPPEMVEKAKRLQTVQLANKKLEEKVRKVAESYVLIARENEKLFEEFKEKYRDKLSQAR